MNSQRYTTRQLLHPRYWGGWLSIGLMRLTALLPDGMFLCLGRLIGRLFMRFDRRRRMIAATNLKLCFPELGETDRAGLLRRHFESVGIGLLEFAAAWWWPEKRLRHRYRITGLEHLKSALAAGRGVLMFSAHFTPVEIGGRLLKMHAPELPLNAMYRPYDSAVMEHVSFAIRDRNVFHPIPRDNAREMIRVLRQGEIVWYAADQNYSRKGSVFADFFGVPAATNTAINRFAEASDAQLVPYVGRRLPNGRDYELEILPPLEGFPSDPQADAVRLNKIIETWVRAAPEQYFWLHRRFKTRPNNEPKFY